MAEWRYVEQVVGGRFGMREVAWDTGNIERHLIRALAAERSLEDTTWGACMS